MVALANFYGCWLDGSRRPPQALDDGRKLCLSSGEALALVPAVRLLFEAEELRGASPATISRAAVVFMPAEAVGADALITCWCGRARAWPR